MEMNLVIAGEFIVMASTLMRIKARMMIPRIDLMKKVKILTRELN